jgi:hypothetical protein
MSSANGEGGRNDDRAASAAPLPYFLHINKNAGNTLRDVILSNYPEDRVMDVLVRGRGAETGLPKTVESRDEPMVTAVEELQRRQHELACAALNIPYGVHRKLERPIAYFTLLREPVERCISYWFFAYEHRHEHPLWWELERYDFNPERVIAERAAYQFSNDQIRMVTGSDAVEPGEDELELAKEVLEEGYAYVGVVEEFDVGLELIGRRFGWRNLAYEKQMVGQKTETSILPPNARRVFQDANEWDIRLHEWVVASGLPHRYASRHPSTVAPAPVR